MVLAAIRNTLSELRRCRSGNAGLLVALGMPVLIGGAGLGVDLAQWYMWKRELQFAVDQAAIAGAWARAETATESTYITRATQEFDANLSVTDDFNAAPTVQLANFAGGVNNSVAVWSTATKALPFSYFLTGESASIYAYAQASFEEGVTFTSCLIATDEDDEGAVTIGGSAILTASCGIAALSTDELAVRVNGNPTVDAGWILTAGGVDPWLKENTDDIILEHMDGLYDPFEELEPPHPQNSQVRRTYSCTAQAATTTATITTTVATRYEYYQGSSTANNQGWVNDARKQNTTTVSANNGVIVPTGTQPSSTSSSTTTWTQIGGSGSDKKFEKKIVTTTIAYSNIVVTPGGQAGQVIPGTYSNIHVGCDTTFAPGVYIIDGGSLQITGQYEVTGSSVLFVLRNGASVQIAGGADINLTAIQASDLISAGVSPEEANDLAGMLVFEERNSPGTNQNNLNGNSNTVLNGTLYFPVSEVFFAGTASVTSQCLMIAADNIIFTGTTNMSTFCPAGSEEDTTVVSTAAKVRLVV